MKKILSLLVLAAIAVGSLCLVSCGEKNYKVGVGIYASVDAIDAEGETAGSAVTNYTMAAILVDEDGKIVGCEIDVSYHGDVSVSAAGVCTIEDAMTTKRTLGNGYGMSSSEYAPDRNGDGKVLEWYEQADAFASVAIGKNLDEVKALVGSDYYGTEDVVNAGCTITVSDFALAIEKAFANTKDLTASGSISADSVNLGVVVSSTSTNAEGDTKGSAEFIAVATAAVIDGDKVSACITDELDVELEVTSAGVIEGDDVALKTKRELGDDYGMSSSEYAPDRNGDGKVLEWYAQADAFDAACAGKTADEIAALVVSSGYAVEDVQTAGCTITAYNFAKSAAAAAKTSK